jgi:hypothetical protein
MSLEIGLFNLCRSNTSWTSGPFPGGESCYTALRRNTLSYLIDSNYWRRDSNLAPSFECVSYRKQIARTAINTSNTAAPCPILPDEYPLITPFTSRTPRSSFPYIPKRGNAPRCWEGASLQSGRPLHFGATLAIGSDCSFPCESSDFQLAITSLTVY